MITFSFVVLVWLAALLLFGFNAFIMTTGILIVVFGIVWFLIKRYL